MATVVNFAAVAVILHFLKMKISPEYAMVMLPMVLPECSPVYFGVNVAVTSLAILGTIYILINQTSLKLTH